MHERCLADIGGPFYDPAKPFRNWTAFPFYQLDLQQPPYVDREQLAWGVARARQYLAQIHAQGYTGIVVDNLPHLVTFEHAPVQLYAPDSSYRQRAEIYRSLLQPLFEDVAQRGMELFVTADMQWSTPPVRRYAGGLNADNPRLAEVNRWAAEELFTSIPQVSGIMVRVGETGGAHDLGTDYAGHMIYTRSESLRNLMDTLLPVCEQRGRLLVMRTWSIGIGELGDLMWSPERYHATFGDYTSPALLVSIKHGPSDFFRLLPHNPTLGAPGPQQLIELQNRREYELFGMVPSNIGPLHQQVIGNAQATNPRFGGVWAWNCSGGWGGGRAALGEEGWSAWTQLSSAITAALVQNTASDTSALARAHCVDRFGEAFGTAMAAAYHDSADAMERGWYLGPLARRRSALRATYLPSLLWVWWMRPTASLLVWAYLAAALEDAAGVAQAGRESQARMAEHAAQLVALAPNAGPGAQAVAESVAYLADVLAVAQAIRPLMLNLAAAAARDERVSWEALVRGAGAARQVLARHLATWSAHPTLPPLELDEVAAFLAALERAPGRVWLQARLACRLVGRLYEHQRAEPRERPVGTGLPGYLMRGLLARGVRRVGALAGLVIAPPLRQRAVRAVLPWLSRRFYLLPSIFFETGPAFSEWTP